MKREIIFRGKGLRDGKWIEGGVIQGVKHELWQNADRVFIMVFPQYLSTPNLCEVYPETVGQFTGLYDKNCKRIFEGDIVEKKRRSPLELNTETEVVEWIDFACGFWPFYRCGECEGTFYTETCEVIGNIHDDKLEGK